MKFRNILLVLVTTSLTLCLSSCYKWAARAHKELPKQTALDKTYCYQGKVIIAGAGASGLAAAKVLEQNNIDLVAQNKSIDCFIWGYRI